MKQTWFKCECGQETTTNNKDILNLKLCTKCRTKKAMEIINATKEIVDEI